MYFSYNKTFENDENYKKLIITIEKLLKVLGMRQLSIDGKILIFKTLAILKVIFYSPSCTRKGRTFHHNYSIK